MQISVLSLKTMTHTRLSRSRFGACMRRLLLSSAFVTVIGISGCAATPSRALSTNQAVPATSPDFGVSETFASDAAAQYHVLAGEMAVQRGMPKTAAQHYVAALQYTSNAKLARRATRIALYAGASELAYTAAQHWARLAPDTLDAQRTATRLALIQGDAQALLDYGGAVLALADTRDDGYLLLADVLSGKPARGDLAVAALQQLAQADSGSASAWYALALTCLRYAQPEAAMKAVQKAVVLAPTWNQAAVLQAAVLIRLGRPDRAQAVIGQLPGSQAQRSQYHLTLARLLLDGAQPKAALEEFSQALALQPDNADARYGMAVLALSQKDYERAASAFKHLYQTGEHGAASAYYLGAIYERRQAYTAAERWYRRVRDGRHAFAAQVGAARMHARQGKLAAARAQIQQLRARYPAMSGRLAAAEGQMLFVAARYTDALQVYDDAIAKQSDDDDLLYGRSIVNEKLDRVDAAKADLQTLLKQNPDSVRALNALGYLLTNHSTQYTQALNMISKALEQDPDNPAILDSAGWVYYHLGQLDKALNYLQRAYAAFPDPEVAAHLGEVLWQLGRHDQARRIWHAALSDHPDHTLLKQTIARFAP